MHTRGAATTHPVVRSEIFISYSRRDVTWLARLKVHLEPLVQRERLHVWDADRIQPGEQWLNEVREAIERARVAVLLVSPDYLASSFIASEELTPILRAASSSGLQVFWIPVRASIVDKTEIATMQAARSPDRPLAGLRGSAVDTALADIARRIVEVFEPPTTTTVVTTYLELEVGNGVTTAPVPGDQATIGRAVGNDVVLEDDEASRWHAVVERFGTAWYIRDLSSRNGTTVNGTRVGSEHKLGPGDRIRIGRTSLVFRCDDPPPESDTTRAATGPPDLTPVERDVLIELARPLASGGPSTEPATDDEIGQVLDLAAADVAGHVARLLEIFAVPAGVAQRTRLTNEAISCGAIDAAAFGGPGPTS